MSRIAVMVSVGVVPLLGGVASVKSGPQVEPLPVLPFELTQPETISANVCKAVDDAE